MRIATPDAFGRELLALLFDDARFPVVADRNRTARDPAAGTDRRHW